jgi:hypothetical protein
MPSHEAVVYAILTLQTVGHMAEPSLEVIERPKSLALLPSGPTALYRVA